MNPPEKSIMANSNITPVTELSTIELCKELQANARAQDGDLDVSTIASTIARGTALLEEFETRTTVDPQAREEATNFIRAQVINNGGIGIV